MSVVDEESPAAGAVWAPTGIADARKSNRKPGVSERWAMWKMQVRMWDKRIWWFLASVTAIFLLMGAGTWFAGQLMGRFNDGQTAFAEALVGDRDANAQGTEQEMALFLRQAGDPFAQWKSTCIPSNHTKTVVGVGIDRNGNTTDNLNRQRGWELVMAVQQLGPVDLTNVYVGDVGGTVVASKTPTADAPGKMCAPLPPTTTTTTGS